MTHPIIEGAPRPAPGTSRSYIVEVSCQTDWEALDPRDLDENGECLRDGGYRVTLTGEPLPNREARARVMAIFEERAELFSEDAYGFLFRHELVDEAAMGADWIRQDLGRFPAQGEPDAADAPAI